MTHQPTFSPTTLALLTATALLTILAGVPATRADTLVIQGSTTFNSELMVSNQAAIEAAVHHTLRVIPNKSYLGLLALFKGEADLAMISTSLENEADILRRSNPELAIEKLEVFAVARTQAALVTHSTNPVLSISDEDLRRVLSGTITNWDQLGGASMPIRIVAVREGGGVVSSVEASILGSGQHITAPNQIRVQNGPQIVKVVEQEPGALGITQTKLTANRQLRHLATALPIEQQLNLISLGKPSQAMLDVISACRNIASPPSPH